MVRETHALTDICQTEQKWGGGGDLSVLSRPLPLLSFHLLKHRSFLNYFLMGVEKGGGGW